MKKVVVAAIILLAAQAAYCQSSINVARDNVFTGKGCDVAVKVNGQKVAVLENGKAVSIPVKPGTYKVSVGTGVHVDSFMCPDVLSTRTVVVTEQPFNLRVGFTTNMQFQFEEAE